MDFGAFVELEPAVEGLVHISALAYRRVEKVEDVVNVGDEVSAKVLSIDTKKRKISLSIKALTEAPVTEKKEKDEKDEKKTKVAADREVTPTVKVKSKFKELRGGRDSGATGGLFG